MAKRPPGAPSVAAVAKRAGVSATAVSLVLGGRADEFRLSEETRERVRAAATALGYARASRRRGQARLHIVHAADLFSMDVRGLGGAVVQPLIEALTGRGWLASIDPRLPGDPGRAVLGASAVLVPVNRGFDAPARALADAAAAHGVQAVLLGRIFADLAAIQADGDQAGGGRALGEHLRALGHRRVAVVAGDASDRHTIDRVAGLRAAFADDADAVVAWGDAGYRIADAHRLVSARLAAGERPTAIACCNDAMAVGALLALTEAGRRVPADVSVVGFDDHEEYRDVGPGLTTVRIDATGAGTRIAELLARAGAPRREVIRMPARLVARGSTGPARRGR